MAKITKISQQALSAPSLPAILAEYGDLHWSITVGKKPRGFWRPPLTIKFWHEGIEGDNLNALNIDPNLSVLEFLCQVWGMDDSGLENFLYCHSCSECRKEKVFQFLKCPVVFWNASDPHTAQTNACNLRKLIDRFNFFCEQTTTIFPDWRPGRPDYSDVIDWVRRKVCEPITEEYNKRILEAYQSEPIEEETTISSETVKMEAIQKEVQEKKRPSRKLKMA